MLQDAGVASNDIHWSRLGRSLRRSITKMEDQLALIGIPYRRNDDFHRLSKKRRCI